MFMNNTVQTKHKRLKPKGKLGRTVIVLPGVHCCADFSILWMELQSGIGIGVWSIRGS